MPFDLYDHCVFLVFSKNERDSINDLKGGKMPSVGEDLALRSLCNHSIIGVSLYLMKNALF